MDSKVNATLRKRKYFRYKRLCRIANNFTYNENNIQSMLKYYAAIEKACLERTKFRDEVIPEDKRDDGHEYQIEALKEKLKYCEERINYLLTIPSRNESDEEETIEDEVVEEKVVKEVNISPVKSSKAMQKEIEKENNEYLEKEITAKKIVEVVKEKIVREIGKCLHSAYFIEEEYEKWMDSAIPCFYLKLVVVLVCRLEEVGFFSPNFAAKPIKPQVKVDFRCCFQCNPKARLRDLVSSDLRHAITLLESLRHRIGFLANILYELNAMIIIAGQLFVFSTANLDWDEQINSYSLLSTTL